MTEKCCYNKILMKFLLRSEEKWNGQTWCFLFSFQYCPFWAYIKKKAHPLFGAWSFLLICIRFTPSEGPKGFINWYSRNRTMKVGIWSQTMAKGKPPWYDFMVHGVNQPWIALVICLWNNTLYYSVHCVVWAIYYRVSKLQFHGAFQEWEFGTCTRLPIAEFGLDRLAKISVGFNIRAKS